MTNTVAVWHNMLIFEVFAVIRGTIPGLPMTDPRMLHTDLSRAYGAYNLTVRSSVQPQIMGAACSGRLRLGGQAAPFCNCRILQALPALKATCQLPVSSSMKAVHFRVLA